MVSDGKNKVNIAFRVDSSSQMGSGHLMRCLTLAKKLQDCAEIIFISRNLAGNLNYLIEENGYVLLQLPRMKCQEVLMGYEEWLTVKLVDDAMQTKEILQGKEIDCLIIDHYAINDKWEKELRNHVRKIMVIDDLANRKHDCDILLDQNYYRNLQERYKELVPKTCRLLLGPQYALLREEFYEARKSGRVRDGIIRNILVFFGGSDLTNETMKALLAIKTLDRLDITVNVVVGARNPHKNGIKKFCDENANLRFHCQINYIAKLMNEADITIGAGGTTTWERCYLSLPAIVIAIAENQVQISEDSNYLGYIDYLGVGKEVDVDKIKNCIKKYIGDPDSLKRVASKGSNLVGLFDIKLIS